MMASPDLIGRQACHALRVIKRPWRKYSRHVEFESSFQSATLMRLHAAFTFTQPVKTGQPRNNLINVFYQIHDKSTRIKVPTEEIKMEHPKQKKPPQCGVFYSIRYPINCCPRY